MKKKRSRQGRSQRRRYVGLLGGSFNPAHDGHLHISREALKRLRLQEVWWLVSPQNPLKDREGMAPLADRMASAKAVSAGDRRIRPTDIEVKLGTTYTAQTLAKLIRHYPNLRFVWLMGSDNLIQIPRWRDWNKIFMLVPIAVFTRPTYDSRALSGKAAQRYRRCRLPLYAAGRLAQSRPPVWSFVSFRRHPASATAIRSGESG
ncbi:nicotinate-nucleotide adenylyltransferase [Hwanghaeella grinnelliae]|uniref:Probable nicotinate-nucleotide adenylyltransferase n=1 Tax=Hwanghaeella grinnelliae TaxID=2500179 RepID=A0A437QQ75_9PROT|nr:nicotinate-nucleotide adenylyltransferase [Hwanghaeella grinnelliae]RVU36686.1 nicotinate-nucleotide adenylyltransferase [Hwanghaeella grinnelliae]